MSMFKYMKLLVMSHIQEHGLCIKAGHGFLLFGIGHCTLLVSKNVFLCYV